MENKKVLLGMSGGVDSSVAAIVLKLQGYEVIGATMKLWDPEDPNDGQSLCCGDDAVYDAKRVCDTLDIPHYTLNLKKEFKSCVIDNFINEYKNAKTPNPCVQCNKYLKFKYFYQKALELGCAYIATGHYAKKAFSEKYNRYVLKKSNENKKDQTYFLYNIPQSEIEKIIFPLQDFENKEDIRKIAEQYGLLVAKKKDSQEICFIPDNNYTKFLINNMDKNPKTGNIALKTGELLGKHKGLIYYTIGQRKGLRISYKEPLYVVSFNKDKNEVIVGTKEDLYTNILYANNLNWLVFNGDLQEKIECFAKIRYRAKEAKATVQPTKDGTVKVEFKEPQRAITKGQSVVFYLDDIVLGGGIIL